MTALDPPGLPPVHSGRLVDRAGELTTIQQHLTAAEAGRGGVLLIEGPAGIGTSALLDAAAEMARGRGAVVLTARATELEATFAWGVALQLLEPVWLAADSALRAELVREPASPVAALLSGGQAPAPAPDYGLIHALFAAIRNLAALPATGDRPVPVVLCVDAVQWADPASVRLLAYLGPRIGELPVLVVAATTGTAAASARQSLEALRAGEWCVRLRPAPLSVDGVEALLRRRLPAADRGAAAALAAVTGGNPALVQAMLDDATEQELTTAGDAALISGLLPEPVVDDVRRRLGRVTRDGRALAVAVAVLGPDASLATAGGVTGLVPGHLLPLAEELVEAGLLASSHPLAFPQPLVLGAVLAGLPPSERVEAHSRTAAALLGHGAGPGRVAPHLMAIPPGTDPRALGMLRRCAASARAAGDTALAAALLERALRHRPHPEERAELLIDLAVIERESGRSRGSERLAQARAVTSDPRRRAEIALLEAEADYADGAYRRAALALEAALQALDEDDAEARRELAVAYVVAAALVPDLQAGAVRVRDGLLDGLAAPTGPADTVALAHTTLPDALSGQRPQTVSERARRAWGDGALLSAIGPRDPTLATLLMSLIAVDELEAAEEIGRQIGRLPAAAAWLDGGLRPLNAWIRYLRGDIGAAAAEARAAADAHRRHWPAQTAVALGVSAACHIQQGDLARAEAAVKAMTLHSAAHQVIAPGQLLLQAQLRLAQHRPDDALDAALQAGTGLAEAWPEARLPILSWRATAAAAYVAMGAGEAALELIEPDLDEARRLGLGRQTIRGLRLKGLAIGGREGTSLLTEAVQLGDAAGGRLEHIHALIDLGAALRRANRRTAAREPLTRGLDLANRAGAGALAARAHTELVASGARPRRLAMSGVESLTASQRRVADLAAQGLTTRQIAETLFVTPKTVEYHLRSIYQKLDVASRAELAELLAA